MNKIKYKITTTEDIEILMQIRLEMLREVNNLPDSYVYDKLFIDESRSYFEEGDQTTVLAMEGEEVVGCASLSYSWIMPTFSHPAGKRAHLMNVYTKPDYRRKGISKRMVEMLIDEAKDKGVTEISLDTTTLGRPLYESIGFKASEECMVMEL